MIVSANPGHSIAHVKIMQVCQLYYLTFDWYSPLTSVQDGGLLSIQSMLYKLSLVASLHTRLLILLRVVYLWVLNSIGCDNRFHIYTFWMLFWWWLTCHVMFNKGYWFNTCGQDSHIIISLFRVFYCAPTSSSSFYFGLL